MNTFECIKGFDAVQNSGGGLGLFELLPGGAGTGRSVGQAGEWFLFRASDGEFALAVR